MDDNVRPDMDAPRTPDSPSVRNGTVFQPMAVWAEWPDSHREHGRMPDGPAAVRWMNSADRNGAVRRGYRPVTS